MACYVVTFDAIDIETIRTRLKTLSAYCPIHPHAWAVVTDKTAVQLRDFLSQGFPTSRIFVVRSGTEAAWLNAYGEKNNEWLKKNL
jgi:hypothetical protein